MQLITLPIFIFVACVIGLVLALLLVANLFNPIRPGRVKRMPYESGMDPIHDTRRRFDVRFYLLAIAFLVFDVELLFLYPWAVAAKPAAIENTQLLQTGAEGNSILSETDKRDSPIFVDAKIGTVPITPGIDAAVNAGLVQNRDLVFAVVMIFIALLILGFVYDWRKGVFQWR